MDIIANRADLLGVSRNLVRLLPAQSPIADLTGILMEADENDGTLRLVATNLEVTLEYRFPATVAEGGRMVINGRLLAHMMPLLRDNQVLFRTQKGSDMVRIENGTAVFELSCLSGSRYPELQPATPDISHKAQGLESLVGQTAFAAVKQAKTQNILGNAKLEVFPSEARMTCTDGSKLAVARHRWETLGQSGAQTSAHFLLPISTLPLIIKVCGNEDVEIGLSANMLVISGSNYKLCTRTMPGIYPDTNALLAQLKPVYTAIVGASAFWEDLDRVSILAEPGDTVQIVLQESGIGLSYQQETNGFSSITEAVVYNATTDGGFHYSISDLYTTLRYMKGNLSVAIDGTGNMLLKTGELCYLLTPRRLRSASAVKAGQKTDKRKKTTRRKKAA